MAVDTTQAFDTPGIGRPPRLMAWLLLAPLLLWLLLFVIVPTIIMIVVSFNTTNDIGEVVYGSPTLGNYSKIFSRATVWPLMIAAGAGLLAMIVGAAAVIYARPLRHRLLAAGGTLWPMALCLLLLLPAIGFDLWAFPHYADRIQASDDDRDEIVSATRQTLLMIPLCGLLATAVIWSLIAPSANVAVLRPARLALAFGIAIGLGVFWAVLNLVLLLHVRDTEFADVPFMLIFSQAQNLRIFVVSVNYAAFSTAICALMGYPVAYFIGKARERWRNILLMLVMIPFWTSFLVRTYAWVTILRREGVLNSLLINLGVLSADNPLNLFPSQTGVMIGLIYTYLPFMILPIYTSIERLDNALIEAAFDLGASPLRAFNSVIFPLTKPGVVAGILLVFVPAIGMFAVNDILGGQTEILIGNQIEQQFGVARDKPFGAALGMLLLLVFVATYYFATRKRTA